MTTTDETTHETEAGPDLPVALAQVKLAHSCLLDALDVIATVDVEDGSKGQTQVAAWAQQVMTAAKAVNNAVKYGTIVAGTPVVVPADPGHDPQVRERVNAVEGSLIPLYKGGGPIFRSLGEAVMTTTDETTHETDHDPQVRERVNAVRSAIASTEPRRVPGPDVVQRIDSPDML